MSARLRSARPPLLPKQPHREPPRLARAPLLSTGPARSGGQATVEVVALLPLVVLVALAIGQLLAAGAAREAAGNAAEAGAVAILQGGDPAAAARAALPGWSRDRTVLRVRGRRVEVRVRPRTVVPVLASRLEAEAVADAGPALDPSAPVP